MTSPTRTIVIGVAVAAVAGVLGLLSADHADIAALVALGVLGVGLTISAPFQLIAFALPATLLMARVGGLLSVSDVVLAAAAVLALLLVPARETAALRPLLWAGVAYLAAALPTVVLNPFAANTIEWVHEVVLVVGSMLVGFAIGLHRVVGLAVGGYVVACIVVALAAVFVAVTTGSFGNTYLPDLHKNYIGGALAIAVVLLFGRPVWFRWPRSASWVAIVVLAVGLVAAGSRQGMAAAVVGVLVVSLRPHPETGRIRVFPWLLAVPTVIAIVTLVRDQLSEDNPFNSAYQRLDWYSQSIAIWLQSPVFGVGLRWWYTGRYASFQPPNAELEVLTSVGVVGLVGFLVMFVAGFVTLWRIDPRYGTVAAAVIAARFTQAQFDLYWVAGQSALLWIVAGVAIGALKADERAAAAGGRHLPAALPQTFRQTPPPLSRASPPAPVGRAPRATLRPPETRGATT